MRFQKWGLQELDLSLANYSESHAVVVACCFYSCRKHTATKTYRNYMSHSREKKKQEQQNRGSMVSICHRTGYVVWNHVQVHSSSTHATQFHVSSFKVTQLKFQVQSSSVKFLVCCLLSVKLYSPFRSFYLLKSSAWSALKKNTVSWHGKWASLASNTSNGYSSRLPTRDRCSSNYSHRHAHGPAVRGVCVRRDMLLGSFADDIQVQIECRCNLDGPTPKKKYTLEV